MNSNETLWELIGPYWTLPVYVSRFANLMEVRLAPIPLLDKMKKVASEVFSGKERRGEVWFIHENESVGIMRRSDLTDPEDVVMWDKPREFDAEEHPAIDDEFIVGYIRSEFAMTRDPLIVDVLWVSLCRYMLHRLVNEEKEVNLKFATLVPLSFRQNWQNAAAKWEEHKRGKELTSERMKRYDYLKPNPQNMVDRGVADYLCTSYVTELRGGVLGKTVNIVLNNKFHRAVMRTEAVRRRLSGGQYWKRMAADTLRRQLPKALEVYADYLENSKLPNVAILESVFDSTTGEYVRRGGSGTPMEGNSPINRTVLLQAWVEEVGPPDDDDDPLEPLLGCLPDLRFNDKDVRDEWENVY